MSEQISSTPVPENTPENTADVPNVPATWKRNMSPSQLANLRRAPDDGEFPVSIGGKISEEMDEWIRSLPESRSYIVRQALTLYRTIRMSEDKSLKILLQVLSEDSP